MLADSITKGFTRSLGCISKFSKDIFFVNMATKFLDLLFVNLFRWLYGPDIFFLLKPLYFLIPLAIYSLTIYTKSSLGNQAAFLHACREGPLSTLCMRLKQNPDRFEVTER